MFIGSLWGLYKLGREPIRLKSSMDDRMFGAEPFGSLSLTLVSSFMIFIGIGIFLFVTDSFGKFPPTVFAIFVVVLLVGVALFFLPLLKVHGNMARQKREEWRKVREERHELLSARATPRDGIDATYYLADLTRVEMSERTVASAATWPFDTSVIGRLIATFLSVIAILISSYLKNFIPGLY